MKKITIAAAVILAAAFAVKAETLEQLKANSGLKFGDYAVSATGKSLNKSSLSQQIVPATGQAAEAKAPYGGTGSNSGYYAAVSPVVSGRPVPSPNPQPRPDSSGPHMNALEWIIALPVLPIVLLVVGIWYLIALCQGGGVIH